MTLTDVSEVVDLRTIAENAFIELKDKSELLEHEASFDAVTGLVNRGHFTQLLENSIARASGAAGLPSPGSTSTSSRRSTTSSATRRVTSPFRSPVSE